MNLSLEKGATMFCFEALVLEEFVRDDKIMSDAENKAQKRLATRGSLDDISEAVVTTSDKTIRGKISNLGSTGMFLKSQEELAVDEKVEILLMFLPDERPDLSMYAKGKVVRVEETGLAFHFTDIDIGLLGKYIIALLNIQSSKVSEDVFKLPSAEKVAIPVPNAQDSKSAGKKGGRRGPIVKNLAKAIRIKPAK